VDDRGVIVSSQFQAQQNKVIRENPVNDYDPSSVENMIQELKKYKKTIQKQNYSAHAAHVVGGRLPLQAMVLFLMSFN
jgi:hypothetical protein